MPPEGMLTGSAGRRGAFLRVTGPDVAVWRSVDPSSLRATAMMLPPKNDAVDVARVPLELGLLRPTRTAGENHPVEERPGLAARDRSENHPDFQCRRLAFPEEARRIERVRAKSASRRAARPGRPGHLRIVAGICGISRGCGKQKRKSASGQAFSSTERKFRPDRTGVAKLCYFDNVAAAHQDLVRGLKLSAGTKSLRVARGRSLPLGATMQADGINFALLSRHANRVILVVYPIDGPGELAEVELDPRKNRTGDHWHVLVSGLPPTFRYGWRVDG